MSRYALAKHSTLIDIVEKLEKDVAALTKQNEFLKDKHKHFVKIENAELIIKVRRLEKRWTKLKNHICVYEAAPDFSIGAVMTKRFMERLDKLE